MLGPDMLRSIAFLCQSLRPLASILTILLIMLPYSLIFILPTYAEVNITFITNDVQVFESQGFATVCIVKEGTSLPVSVTISSMPGTATADSGKCVGSMLRTLYSVFHHFLNF